MEIETGPYFGGQISVDVDGPIPKNASENAPEKRLCVLNGNATSSQTIYVFEIDHSQCDGVEVSLKRNLKLLCKQRIILSSFCRGKYS